MHDYWWPSAFMELIYKDLQRHSDPLLFVRKHQLIAKPSGSFSIGDMYDFEAPKGFAIGYSGRRRRWSKLLHEFVSMNTWLSTFEQGIFRVAARAIDIILEIDVTPTPRPTLTREQIAVLEVLRGADRLVTQKEIGTLCKTSSLGSKLSRGTLVPLLQEFRHLNLVDHKTGKGYALTDDGRKTADSLLSSHKPGAD